MADYSFLRLNTDFNQAKSDMMVDSEYFYNGGICLHPQETYLQTTNSKTSIAFDESYKVELINCSGSVLKDITTNVYIHEFQDNNGIYQISYEILPIEQDFYFERLYLKFTQTTSTLVLYSNGFFLTAETDKDTFRVDYKSYREYKGTNYVLADFYQSIRLFGYFNAIAEKKESKVYTEVNGKIRKSRVIQSFEYTFDLEDVNTNVYKSLAVALESDLVYINGLKAEILETLTADERKGKSNIFDANFKCQLDEDQVYLDTFQIAPQLTYTNLQPFDIYNFFPINGTAVFNYPISLGSGTLKLYTYDSDSLVSEISISVTDNYFTFDLPLISLGKYYFLFDENLINSNFGSISISNKDIWTFEVSEGQFDNTEFDNNDFLTN